LVGKEKDVAIGVSNDEIEGSFTKVGHIPSTEGLYGSSFGLKHKMLLSVLRGERQSRVERESEQQEREREAWRPEKDWFERGEEG